MGGTQCHRPRRGRPQPGRRRSRRLRYQPKAKRRRGHRHSRGRGIRNDYTGSLVTPGRRASDRDEPRARPDGRRKGLWDRSRAGAHEAYPCTCVECSVVCPLAPSRGGVLQLRGNPVHGTNPRRPVFTLRPFPCERAPPGLGLSCPQPDPIIRPAGCAPQLPGPGCEANDCTPSAPRIKLPRRTLARDWKKRRESLSLSLSLSGLRLARTGTNTGTPSVVREKKSELTRWE